MVGLLINTVPVRATITPATTTAELLDQLQHAHNHTLDHQHLALSEIHRVTGHDQLFDTLFVYENYPVDTAALADAHELAVTDITDPRIHPLPADIGSHAGPANWACASNTTPTSSTPDHRDTHRRGSQRVLVAMTADPDAAVVVDGCARCR